MKVCEEVRYEHDRKGVKKTGRECGPPGHSPFETNLSIFELGSLRGGHREEAYRP